MKESLLKRIPERILERFSKRIPRMAFDTHHGSRGIKGGKIMNISSVGNQWSIFTKYLKTHQTNNTAEASQSALNALNLQSLQYSADGDSLEISNDAQNELSNYMMYGPPPPPPNGAGGTGFESGIGSEIKDFLDKVASGTATQDDLDTMQSVLQKMQQQSGTRQVNSNSKGDGTDPIKSFLDKVAAGTATTEDLTSMQSVLQQVQQSFAPNGEQGNRTGSGSDPIREFLDKVANGTITDDDLKTMQNVLKQMQQQSGSNGAHMHHRHQSSESESTNPNGTSLDTTYSGSGIKEFLDKVANGTATDDDLKDMQSLLKQMQQEMYNNFRFNSNLGGINPELAAGFFE
jgi:regulator of sigma D